MTVIVRKFFHFYAGFIFIVIIFYDCSISRMCLISCIFHCSSYYLFLNCIISFHSIWQSHLFFTSTLTRLWLFGLSISSISIALLLSFLTNLFYFLFLILHLYFYSIRVLTHKVIFHFICACFLFLLY